MTIFWRNRLRTINFLGVDKPWLKDHILPACIKGQNFHWINPSKQVISAPTIVLAFYKGGNQYLNFCSARNFESDSDHGLQTNRIVWKRGGKEQETDWPYSCVGMDKVLYKCLLKSSHKVSRNGKGRCKGIPCNAWLQEGKTSMNESPWGRERTKEEAYKSNKERGKEHSLKLNNTRCSRS